MFCEFSRAAVCEDRARHPSVPVNREPKGRVRNRKEEEGEGNAASPGKVQLRFQR
jgi:hypothetical protein